MNLSIERFGIYRNRYNASVSSALLRSSSQSPAISSRRMTTNRSSVSKFPGSSWRKKLPTDAGAAALFLLGAGRSLLLLLYGGELVGFCGNCMFGQASGAACCCACAEAGRCASCIRFLR